jgi:hypothetical protein
LIGIATIGFQHGQKIAAQTPPSLLPVQSILMIPKSAGSVAYSYPQRDCYPTWLANRE